MFDMFSILNKAKEVQEKVKEAKSGLDKIPVSGESGAGLVKVQATAARKIVSIDIDATIINKDDVSMLQDLVTAAVNKALESAEAAAKIQMQKATEGMPNIPGFDLSNLGGLM